MEAFSLAPASKITTATPENSQEPNQAWKCQCQSSRDTQHPLRTAFSWGSALPPSFLLLLAHAANINFRATVLLFLYLNIVHHQDQTGSFRIFPGQPKYHTICEACLDDLWHFHMDPSTLFTRLSSRCAPHLSYLCFYHNLSAPLGDSGGKGQFFTHLAAWSKASHPENLA